MKNKLQVLLFLLGCFSLIGCGTTIQSNVSVFHNISTQFSSQTIKVLSFNKSLEPSLEYQSYRTLIEAELKKNGFQIVKDEGDSEYIAYVSYGVDSAQTTSTLLPIYGQSGYSPGKVYGSGTDGTTYTHSMPAYGVVGAFPIETTTFARNLALDILEASSLNEPQVKKIYEGRVVSRGTCEQIAPVMPKMVESLFQNFPGTNGETKTVVLPFDKNCQ